jgi:hypothetical protein
MRASLLLEEITENSGLDFRRDHQLQKLWHFCDLVTSSTTFLRSPPIVILLLSLVFHSSSKPS